MARSDPENKRLLAKQNGDKTYFTGLLCVNNHLSPRYTATTICVACKHESFKKQYEAKKDEKLQATSIWREKNREHVNNYSKNYREIHREKTRQSSKQSKIKNRALHTSLERKRLAVKLNASPKWMSKNDLNCILNIYKMARRIQDKSGVIMAVDHIVPLQGKTVCGLHVPWNLRIVSRSENSIKHASLTDDVYLPKQIGVMVGWSGLPWNWSN